MKKTMLVLTLCLITSLAWGKGQFFSIMSDENFSGDCFYNFDTNNVMFDFTHKGSRAYLPKQLICRAWTKDNKDYILEIYLFEKNGIQQNTYTMNPNDHIIIICEAPLSLRNEDLNGFNISLGGDRKIRFGYEKLSVGQKLWRPIYKELTPKQKEDLEKFKKNISSR